MYKRPARVLFLDRDHACLAPMAEGWARALGGRWIEGRSAGLAASARDPRVAAVMAQAGIDVFGLGAATVTPALLAWADLVVALDAETEARCPALPAGTRRQTWALADPRAAADPAAALRRARDHIHGRLLGMIGGMKMLARLDAED